MGQILEDVILIKGKAHYVDIELHEFKNLL
jgi:hypothetical protein